MSTRTPLVGREEEVARLLEVVERAGEGRGSLLLLSGEAGVGKSRLADEVANASPALVLRGAANDSLSVPYGPIVEALRSHLREDPGALADCGPLRGHLALLLPELGEAATESDRATIFEAVRCAFAHLTAAGSAIVILDDLHWSDQASLELLAALAAPLQEMPVLVIAAYRSDGLPRDHRIRWLRNELRRGRRLEEITLDPLDRDQVATLLGELLGEAPSPALVRAIHDRAMGSPFFVEELVAALRTRGAIRPGSRGLELSEGDEVPVPDTVREAVLIGVSELSERAREAAGATAVAGQAFDLQIAADVLGEAGLAELLAAGLLAESDDGRASFRHALTREALYAEVPWMRRRDLHRRFAEALAANGSGGSEVAAHWLGANQPARAREALLQALRQSEAVHAHRDAAAAGRRALELWPEGEDEDLRAETLERFGRCAELAGELTEATKAWRELAVLRDQGGERGGYAVAQRRRQ